MQQLVVRSFWLNEALAAEHVQPAPPLDQATRADVCIVGGGYTGLWTAIHLKESAPGLDVVLVEKDLCGSGASGRNAGFLLSLWSKFLSLQKLCGDEEALRIARASERAVSEIRDFCDDHEIDVDYRHDGWLWAATNESQIGLWCETIDAIAAHDVNPFEQWTPAQVAARAGSPVYLAGVCERNTARIQPALLARGLRRVALQMGVRIHEHTPLVELDERVPAIVRTPAGSVTAEQVVLAMNAWAIRWAEIRKAVVVVSGDMIVTPPIRDRLEQVGWNDGLTVSDGRALLNYGRTTRDGRLAFGKGGMSGRFPFGGRVGSEVEGASDLSGDLERWMHRTYPDLADVGIEHSWRGPIDRTKSGLPFFGRLHGRENIVYAAGYSGNGVGPCYLGSRILGSLVLGRRDEWSACPLARRPTRDFPPEPVRYLGSNLMRHALNAQDKAADEGRTPGWAVRALARFAPAGVSPFKKES